MKTFVDLEFRPYWYSMQDFDRLCKLGLSDEDFVKELEKVSPAKRAEMNFPNGWGVSVLLGSMFYSNGVDTYEVGILKDGELCDDNPIGTNEVVGSATKETVSEIMRMLQGL